MMFIILNLLFKVLDSLVQCAKLETMKKQDAIKLFGKTLQDLGNALGGKGRSAISQWNDDLSEDQKNMVIGAAIRKGIQVPEHLLK